MLTWKPNPLNKDVRSYRVFAVAGGGKTAPLAEVGGRTFSFVFADSVPTEAYGFAVAAVDRQNLEGLKAFVLVK